MGTGEKAPMGRRIGLIGVAALTALLAFGVTSPAVAKKKKKKNPVPAISTTAVSPMSSAGTASATANCAGKTHLSGGGYVVSPHYEPSNNSGLRTETSTSVPLGVTAWNAKSDAFQAPVASGSLTAVARCESNTLSQIGTVVSGTATVPSGTLDNLQIQCPSGTHVVSGGYDGTGLGTYVNGFGAFRIFILQSRRTALNQWTISAFESSVNPASGTINVSALCERDAKGRSINEVSALAPFGNNSRASADASCPAKQHVLSGGFILSPIPSNMGSPPIVGIDEFEPTSNSTWHLGLQSFGAQPGGSSVATYAYCAKDTVKKKKKKKKK
jgi:hypothetical protein